MKVMLYGILIAAALLVPTRPSELGKLKPVEVIRIGKEKDMYLIETDTGDSGQGKTVYQAVWDLKRTTAGTVYLDTAEYLLIPVNETMPQEIVTYLKDNVRICNWEGQMELEETAKYLDAHRPAMKLKEYQTGMALQTLEGQNGKLRLHTKNIE